MQGTFGTNAEWRGVGLNVYFRYRFGGDSYNSTLVNRIEMADLNYNVDRRVLTDRWARPGDKTFFKGAVVYRITPDGAVFTSNPQVTYATTRFIEKDNLLSLETLSIYYRFSEALNKKLHISNSKVSFYMTDVAWWSSIKRERGLDYPFSRSFQLQLQFTF